jgi:ribonuclease Z
VDLDVVFLGTSGSMPTAKRALSATLVRRGGDRLLFDCSEGTQRQLLRSDVGLVELEEIFLTHYHADHYLGLPGMLKTFALRGREVPLTIYGPKGLEELLRTLRRIFGRLTYEVSAVELEAGEELERDGYAISPFAVDHGMAALGYAIVEASRPGRFDVDAADRLGVPDGRERGVLQRGETVTLADGRVVTSDDVLGPPRTGRKLVMTGDTAPAASVVEAAAGADVLVHDATFLADERARARETSHSTAGEAALVAQEAGVKLLALTHVSTRYFDTRWWRRRHSSSRDSRPARLRPHHDPVPGAGRTRAGALGCPHWPADRGRGRYTRRANPLTRSSEAGKERDVDARPR